MNKQTVAKYYTTIAAISLLVVLAACSANSSQSGVAASSVTPFKTQPVVTTSSTATAHPTATSTILATTTTPMPTLPSDMAENRILKLLETNAGCTLPCWWGITPGATTTDELQVILEPFLVLVISDVRYEFSHSGGHFLMHPQPNGLKVGIQYLAQEGVVSMIYINTELINESGSIIYGDIEYQKIMSSYTLEAILSKYGKPERVMVRSFSYLTANNQPTRVLLYYPGKGIVAQYLIPNALRQDGDRIYNLICPAENTISIRLFDPASGMELAQILSIDDNISKYKDIKETTNMDIDTFYSTYKAYDENSLASTCPPFLETPWELWPDSYNNK